MQKNGIQSAYIKLMALNDSLIPLAAKGGSLHDNSWSTFNTTLSTLTSATGDEHYSTLSISPTTVGSRQIVSASTFSSRAYQAVSYLYGTMRDNVDLYQFGEPTKPSVGEGSAITQTSILSQDQKQEVTINIEFNQTLTFINEKLVLASRNFEEGTKERTFIDTLKGTINTAKSTAELLKMILTTASQYGIAIGMLKDLFT